jgi:hypothetical protein
MVKLKGIFKNRNNFMNEISNRALSTGTGEGEKDSGYLPKKGMKRVLGVNKNKPEPWYEKGGYTQMIFPKSDQIYDTTDKKTQIVQVIKRITNLGDKYEGFQADIGSWDKYGDKDYSTDFDLNDLIKMYS